MYPKRQKRKSCEACRSRKLKCSGQVTGCSRCEYLGIVCKFHEKGMPGRPRRWSLNEEGELQHHHTTQSDEQGTQTVILAALSNGQDGMIQQDAETTSTRSTPWPDPTEDFATGGSGGLFPIAQPESRPDEQNEMTFNYNESESMPLLDFDTRAQLDALPLDSFRACLPPAVLSSNATELCFKALATPAETPVSCDCSKQVFESIRTLERTPTFHDTVQILRKGLQLIERILTCQICYDVSKSMSFTLQNVMLVGRLFLEVTMHYHKYLDWIKKYCAGLAEENASHTVYPFSAIDKSSTVSFEISSDEFYSLITHGLQNDVRKLSDLGIQFATRQHNRHLAGHETCLAWQGQCWKDSLDIDPDPTDVCPQSPAARVLTPCYRIVDEARARIRQFELATT